MKNLTIKQVLTKGLKTLFFSSFLVAVTPSVQAVTIVNPYEPIFEGIDFATGFTDTPVLQRVNSLRVNLLNPDIQFFSTPSNGNLPEETIAQTTTQFLDDFDLQVAINANFFAPCCNAAPEPKNLIALAISNGEIVSPSDDMISGNIGEVPDSILLTEDNQAEITSTHPNDDFSEIFTAVSAGPRLLVDGTIVVEQIPANDFSDLNPRTAIGISQDEQFLILSTIDGRQPGFSEGATLFQTGEWLLRFGAYQGLNLDGGGSTTLVREDKLGNPQVLNRPSGGIERFNGNNLGVFASPLSQPIPEPSTLWFLTSAFFYLAIKRSKKELV